jgi:hypothetical protein
VKAVNGLGESVGGRFVFLGHVVTGSSVSFSYTRIGGAVMSGGLRGWIIFRNFGPGLVHGKVTTGFLNLGLFGVTLHAWRERHGQLATGGVSGLDSGSKLLQLLKHDASIGPRKLTPYEAELLEQEQAEAREACRRLMLEALAGSGR